MVEIEKREAIKQQLREKIHRILEGVDVADCVEVLTAVLMDFHDKYCMANEELRAFFYDCLDSVIAMMVLGKTSEEFGKWLGNHGTKRVYSS